MMLRGWKITVIALGGLGLIWVAYAWAGNDPGLPGKRVEGQSATMSMPANCSWSDHFENASKWLESKWTPLTSGTASASISYYWTGPTYATIEGTSLSGDFCSILSEPITCDTGTYNRIEVAISSVLAGTFCKISLVSGGQEFDLAESTATGNITGASGTFAFNYAEKLGWTGNKTFQVKLSMQYQYDAVAMPKSRMTVDYVCVFSDPENDYTWREDFEGATGAKPSCWLDSTIEPAFHTSMSYAEQPSLARISINTGATWGKVLSPSFRVDTQRYHKVAVNVTALDPDTAVLFNIYQKPSYRRFTLGSEAHDESQKKRSPGTYIFELDTAVEQTTENHVGGGIWKSEFSGVNEIFFEVIVEGSESKSIELDSIMLYNYITEPTPVPTPTVTWKTVAKPNPFLPSRGQTTWFNLNESPPSSMVRIYNLKAQKIRTLTNTLEWDGRDEQGRLCEGGLYIFQVETPTKHVSGQVVLIK